MGLKSSVVFAQNIDKPLDMLISWSAHNFKQFRSFSYSWTGSESR